MTAEEIYESVTNGGASDFAQVAAILERHGPWSLIGGLAVNCYVEPVYTVDADIVVVAQHLPAIREELAAAGFRLEQFPHSLNASKAGEQAADVQFTQDASLSGVSSAARSVARVLGQLHSRGEAWKTSFKGRFGRGRDPERRLSKRKKDELDLMRIAEAYPELAPEDCPSEIVDQLER